MHATSRRGTIFAVAPLLLLCGISRPIRLSAQPGPEKKMSEKEKIATWKGEKVRLMPNQPGSRYQYIGGDGSCVRRVSNKGSLPSAQYAGKTGRVVEIGTSGSLARVVVELDGTAEKISATCSWSAFGFLSEMDSAQKLVGKNLWAKGKLGLLPPAEISKPTHLAEEISVPNIEKLTITRADWGDERRAVYLCMKTGAGQEGCLIPPAYSASQGGPGVVQYHIVNRFDADYGGGVAYTSFFHESDPRAAHPKWTAGIWKLIQGQEVALGMTEEAARLACGRDMLHAGASIDAAGNVSSIYECLGQRRKFLIVDGKVTKYID